MAWYRQLKMGSKIILPVALVLTLALGLLSWQIQSGSSTALREVAQRELAAEAGRNAAIVKNFFESAMYQAEAMAKATAHVKGEKKTISRELYLDMLAGLLDRNEAYIAVGAAFEPNAFDGEDSALAGQPGGDPKGRFIPYIVRNEGLTLLENVESSDYYAEPKKRNRTYLTAPYPYTVGGRATLLTTACAPVRENGGFKGVVLVDMQIGTVQTQVDAVKLYDSGFAFLITGDGSIVTHKDKTLEGKSIFAAGALADAAGLKRAMAAGQPFVEQNALLGTESVFYYAPVSFDLSGQTWYLGVTAPLDEVLADAREISWLCWVLSAGTLVLVLAVILLIVRSAVRPLGEIAGMAQKIASGDLGVKVDDSRYGGEVKELTLAIRGMIASLLDNIAKAEHMTEDAKAQTQKAQEAMQEAEKLRVQAENAKREGMLQAAARLEGVVHIISSASEQLSAQIAQSEQGSHRQAERVGETATAMEEMNATVLEVARNAGVAAEGSDNAKSKAEAGSDIVSRSVSALGEVGRSAETMSGEVRDLGQQAEAIGAIMTVISDIADQTNLLALNAAIEAARAGEAGRGFAVVADEVRKLAEKTMTATREVGAAISGIQKGTQRSIDAMGIAADNVQTAAALAEESGSALSDIVSQVVNTADQVRAIAAAAEEQSAASDEINRSISEINEISSETLNTMQEAAKAVHSLAEQAQELAHMITEMKQA